MTLLLDRYCGLIDCMDRVENRVMDNCSILVGKRPNLRQDTEDRIQKAKNSVLRSVYSVLLTV